MRETYVTKAVAPTSDNLSSGMAPQPATVKTNYTDFINNNMFIFSFCALFISTMTMYAAIYPDHVSMVITDIKNTFLALVLYFFFPG